MKIEELRIGNWVCDSKQPDIIFTVYGMTQEKVMIYPHNDDMQDEWLSIYEIAPIEFTDEWLLKFGFVDDLLSNEKYEFGITSDMSIGQNHELFTFKKCHYVHELQNLYYALTGEELKFKS